jgi:hypothetical protein
MPARSAKVAKVCREIVDPPKRIDPHGFLGGTPLERAEVIDVEVATSLAGKEQWRAVAVFDPVERIEGAGL